MPSRKPPPEALDSDIPAVGVLTDAASNSTYDSADEAHDADDIADVEARAEAARARATALRRQADAAAAESEDAGDEQAAAPLRARLRLRRPGRRGQAVLAALLVSFGALAGSGYLMWHHHQVVQQSRRTAEFTAVARNAVILMMSIDSAKAREDVQRFADETTGQFKAGVLMGAEDMVKNLEQSKVVAKATVQSAGVQSMTEDSAVVLVAAKSEISKPDQPKPEIRTWRLVVDVESDAGQLKISKVEFVP